MSPGLRLPGSPEHGGYGRGRERCSGPCQGLCWVAAMMIPLQSPFNESSKGRRGSQKDEGAPAPRLVGRYPSGRVRPGGHCRFSQGPVGRPDSRGDRGSQQPRAHREGPYRRHRWQRAVPHRGPATGHLYGELHARGLAALPAGRRRADGVVHRDGQRQSSRSARSRTRSPSRAGPGRGRAQREARGVADRRGRQVDSYGSQLQRAARARTGRRHERQRHGHGYRDHVVPDSRRPAERGAPLCSTD